MEQALEPGERAAGDMAERPQIRLVVASEQAVDIGERDVRLTGAKSKAPDGVEKAVGEHDLVDREVRRGEARHPRRPRGRVGGAEELGCHCRGEGSHRRARDDVGLLQDLRERGGVHGAGGDAGDEIGRGSLVHEQGVRDAELHHRVECASGKGERPDALRARARLGSRRWSGARIAAGLVRFAGT